VIALKFNVDPNKVFERTLTELERSQITFAMSKAINEVAAKIHYQWREVAPKVFSNPVQLTRTAALYRKGTKSKPAATVFIRDEANGGVAPDKYLQAQVFGGGRRQKGIERRLTAMAILPAGWFVVPGKGAKTDAHGNIPRSQINAIKSQLNLHDDRYTNETPASRDRRKKRESKKNRGDYFAVSKARGGLKPGVYQRISSGFGRGVATIMRFVQSARYRKRYDIYAMAQTVFNRRLPEIFKAELIKATQSTFNKKFK
jgi:hypothetical protein